MVEQHYNDEHLDSIFHALADPTRRHMIHRLAVKEHTVTELAAPFKMSLAAASKHIKVLEEAGLLNRTVRGRAHICRLEPKSLADAHEWIRYYERFWNDRLDALERVLNKQEKPEAELNTERGGTNDE
jgi:DNA-binding transcriptional ArsR family regulator